MTPARLVASGFCSGFAPVAPGTVGSLAALLLGAGLMTLSPWALPAAALAACGGGVWAVARADALDDPGWVVIDEFAGQFIAMLCLARPTLRGLCAAFLLFRLVDVAKPGPVGWADRQRSALGVMGDDILAGLITAGIIWAARTRWPGLLD
ncbi:MAG: phosphatidylglycerophosphatase A [Acidisphaera sp.]|nr:phosphatidylglycerophosphatase A [Acidisphaera sp.]